MPKMNNAVIVPVNKTHQQILNTRIYRCPKRRKLREGVIYILLNKEKMRVGWAEIIREDLLSDPIDVIYHLGAIHSSTHNSTVIRNRKYEDFDPITDTIIP